MSSSPLFPRSKTLRAASTLRSGAAADSPIVSTGTLCARSTVGPLATAGGLAVAAGDASTVFGGESRRTRAQMDCEPSACGQRDNRRHRVTDYAYEGPARFVAALVIGWNRRREFGRGQPVLGGNIGLGAPGAALPRPHRQTPRRARVQARQWVPRRR